MPQVNTKENYTLQEVQYLATSTYNLMVQSHTPKTYGIWFGQQLVSVCKNLSDVIELLPKLYTAIQAQLAELVEPQPAPSKYENDNDIAKASNYLELPSALAPQVKLRCIDINHIPGMTRYHYNIYSDDGDFLDVLEIFPDIEDREVATQKALEHLNRYTDSRVMSPT